MLCGIEICQQVIERHPPAPPPDHDLGPARDHVDCVADAQARPFENGGRQPNGRTVARA